MTAFLTFAKKGKSDVVSPRDLIFKPGQNQPKRRSREENEETDKKKNAGIRERSGLSSVETQTESH